MATSWQHRWQLYSSKSTILQNYDQLHELQNYMNETNSVKMSKSVSGNFLFLHEPTTMRAFPCIAKYNGIEAKCLWYTQKPLQKSSHELAESCMNAKLNELRVFANCWLIQSAMHFHPSLADVLLFFRPQLSRRLVLSVTHTLHYQKWRIYLWAWYSLILWYKMVRDGQLDLEF